MGKKTLYPEYLQGSYEKAFAMLVVISLFFLISAVWFILLRRREEKINSIKLEYLSSDQPKGTKNDFKLNKLLADHYFEQKISTFGLVWFSSGISLVLGTLLIVQLVDGNRNPDLLREVIGLIGGIGIALSSLKSYLSIANKIEKGNNL